MKKDNNFNPLRRLTRWKKKTLSYRATQTTGSSRRQRGMKRCVLSRWSCFPVGLGLVSSVQLDPKGPTQCCINHHWGWERGNKNPRLGLNPAITQHARRDVWLDSLNYSHRRSLTALNNDRFLSSSAIRLKDMHLWLFLMFLKSYNTMIHGDHSCLKCTLVIISLKKFHSQHNSTPHYCDHFQMENLPRNAVYDCTLPAAHTRDWSDRRRMPSQELFPLFPLGTREKHVNVECKCLACLGTQISCQDGSNGHAVFSWS